MTRFPVLQGAALGVVVVLFPLVIYATLPRRAAPSDRVAIRVENLRLMLAAGRSQLPGVTEEATRRVLLDGIPADPRASWLVPLIQAELTPDAAPTSRKEIDEQLLARVPYPYLRLRLQARTLRDHGHAEEAASVSLRAERLSRAATARVSVISSWFLFLFSTGTVVLLSCLARRSAPPEELAGGDPLGAFLCWLALYLLVAVLLAPVARLFPRAEVAILALGYCAHGAAGILLVRAWVARPMGNTLLRVLAGPEGGAAGALLHGALGLAAAVPLMILAFALSAPLHLRSGTESPVIPMLLEGRPALQIVLFVLLCVIAPLVEETVFRAALFPGLLRRLRPTLAIATCALCFAAVHLEPPLFLPLAALGVVLTTLRYRTGSVLPSMAMHGLWNLQSFVLVKLLLGDITV